MIDYGVLKGRVVDFDREDQGSSPHFHIFVEANGARFDVPVNVKSTDGSTVLFSIVEPLINHRLIAELPLLAEGFTARGESGSAYLDYVREPMCDITAMRTLPPTVAGPTTTFRISLRMRWNSPSATDVCCLPSDRDFRVGFTTFT